MKLARRFLALALAFTMAAALLPTFPAMAEELDPADSSAEVSALSSVSGTVTGFGELEMEEIGLAEKEDLDSLVETMPATLPVYLDGSDTVTEIPVSWYCLADYDTSDDFYFQFSPSWDTLTYPLAEGLDPELDAPYIAVYIVQPTARSSASNEDIIFDYLIDDMGLNSAAACGILANMYAESSFNPKASCKDVNGKTSYGLCQWNGSRYTNLKDWCKENGYDYTTISGQMHFLSYELSTKTYAYILDYLRGVDNSASGAYDAGYYWCYYFEQPANKDKNSKTRGNLAKKTYWPIYGDESITGSDVSNSSSTPTISGETLPNSSMEYGTYFTLRGTISCSSTITSVTAGVYDSENKSVTSASAKPNATSFNVYKLDDDVLFSQVPAGSYTYRITATVGGKKYTVLDYDFTVTPRKLADASASLNSRYTFTGKKLTPNPKVVYGKTTLKKNTDYTLSYKNNKLVGTATVTIKGKGNYSGTIKKTFSIVPKKVLNVAGSSTSSKTMKITWKPRRTVRGYQIQYSTKSDFSNAKLATILGTENSKKTLRNLQSKKTYYVRMRSYYKIDGKCYFSFYSDPIKVKVK